MANLIITEPHNNFLQEFFHVMFRHKNKVIWFFIAVMTIVALVTIFMPRTYTSEAKLLVRLGRESASMDPTATASGQIVQVTQRRESEIKSELEILKSRDLAEKVVDKIGPEVIAPKSFLSVFGAFFESQDHGLRERDRAVRKLMNNWDITSDRDSNIINISIGPRARRLLMMWSPHSSAHI